MALPDGSLIVNGTAFSWGGAKFIFIDDTLEFVAEFSFDEKLEIAHGYGLNKSQAPIKQSAGKYVPGMMKVKGFTGGVQAAREYLGARAVDGKSYSTVIFPILIQYIDANEKPIDIEFLGCRWSSNNDSRAEGSDLFQDEFEIKFMKMNRNKFTLYDSSEEL